MTDALELPDNRAEVHELFANLARSLPELERLWEETSSHWGFEDPVYRFYHQSFKVYNLQGQTLRIVEQLRSLVPGRPLNRWFTGIVDEGTGLAFSLEDNRNWTQVRRPILEAFFHARFFLEMAVRYGRSLAFPPRTLPSGWAALLYLYDLR